MLNTVIIESVAEALSPEDLWLLWGTENTRSTHIKASQYFDNVLAVNDQKLKKGERT